MDGVKSLQQLENTVYVAVYLVLLGEGSAFIYLNDPTLHGLTSALW